MRTEVDLQTLIDLSPAVHYLAAAGGDFARTYVSDGVRAQLGYEPDEFVRDTTFWQRRIHPDDREQVLTDLNAIAERGRQTLEYRFLHADGSWRWLLDELVLVPGDGDDAHRIVGGCLDITERKRAEEAWKKLVSRMEEAQRIAAVGSWEIDVATSDYWWSDETYRLLGEDPATFTPTPEKLVEKIHPDDRPRFLAAVQRALADGKPYCVDYRVVLPDGTERILHGRGRGIARRCGEQPVTYFAGTVQDITQRERTQQALRAAEARNRALLEANPDVIFRIDTAGRYLDLSVSPKTRFPYTKEQLVGRNIRDFYGEEFVREHQRHVRNAIETGEIQLWECRLPLEHGEVDLEARFVRSGDDEVVVLVRDVTAWRTLQREIVSIQERERSRIGRDLHDGLGQELTAASLGLEVLTQKLTSEGSIHAQTVQNLKALVQKCIAATRRVALSLWPGLGQELLIGQALKSLASEVSEHSNVKCRAICTGKRHRHDIDIDTNLYRIAQEAVSNALRHGKPTCIELRYACDGRTIVLEVLDDGVGIPPRRERAEGLGLRSMRYRTQLIHGRFDVAARETGGTRVLCSCPCRR